MALAEEPRRRALPADKKRVATRHRIDHLRHESVGEHRCGHLGEYVITWVPPPICDAAGEPVGEKTEEILLPWAARPLHRTYRGRRKPPSGSPASDI